jgi:hypothetical protein
MFFKGTCTTFLENLTLALSCHIGTGLPPPVETGKSLYDLNCDCAYGAWTEFAISIIVYKQQAQLNGACNIFNFVILRVL